MDRVARYLAAMTENDRIASTIAADDLFDPGSILPPDRVDADGLALPVLHDREYRVRAFRLAEDRVLIRGPGAIRSRQASTSRSIPSR